MPRPLLYKPRPLTVLWTAQGQILIQNSSKASMSLTSGLFWLMLQFRWVSETPCIAVILYIFFSLIGGNIFFYVFLKIQPPDTSKKEKGIGSICICELHTSTHCTLFTLTSHTQYIPHTLITFFMLRGRLWNF